MRNGLSGRPRSRHHTGPKVSNRHARKRTTNHTKRDRKQNTQTARDYRISCPTSGLGKSTVRSLLRRVPPASPATTNDDIFQRFEADSGLMSIPVVSEGSPLGLINRHEMTNNLARPFRRELFGRKTCKSSYGSDAALYR